MTNGLFGGCFGHFSMSHHLKQGVLNTHCNVIVARIYILFLKVTFVWCSNVVTACMKVEWAYQVVLLSLLGAPSVRGVSGFYPLSSAAPWGAHWRPGRLPGSLMARLDQGMSWVDPTYGWYLTGAQLDQGMSWVGPTSGWYLTGVLHLLLNSHENKYQEIDVQSNMSPSVNNNICSTVKKLHNYIAFYLTLFWHFCLKMLGLYLYTLIISHKSCNM